MNFQNIHREVPDAFKMNDLLLELMRGINAQTFAAVGSKVVFGPFKGMEIPEFGPWDDGNSSCKLFGSYEFELHDAIAHALSRNPNSIINVGCAEGYYAIGLAMLTDVPVFAVDIDDISLELCREYAKRNGVADRLVTYNGCKSAGELQGEGGGHRLYVVDVETAELMLLDKTECPALVNSDIIVECHDFIDPNISMTIAKRFADTHGVEIIKPRLPWFARYEFLNKAPTVMAVLAVAEKRPMPTLWLALWANQKGT